MTNEDDARQHPHRAQSGSGCLSLVCLLFALPAAGLGLAWLKLGLSAWSALLALGLGLVALGCALLGRRNRSGWRALGAGLVLVLAPCLARGLFTREGDSVRLTTLPADSGARLVSTLYPESDGTIAAGALLQAVGRLHDEEAGHFREILSQAYARTEPSATNLATPAIPTYLGLETPSAFDTIVIQPPARSSGARKPDAAVIFLHGYAGNFYVYCWELAQAAAEAKLITLCPSLDASGAWWTPAGSATLRASIDYAHGLGAQRVYLAGLSNGAAGASELVFTYQRELSGLILISGVRAKTPPALPVLVVQGTSDSMMPAPRARDYAARSSRVQYRELDGGHLIFLSRYQQVRPTIADFLRGLEKQR